MCFCSSYRTRCNSSSSSLSSSPSRNEADVIWVWRLRKAAARAFAFCCCCCCCCCLRKSLLLLMGITSLALPLKIRSKERPVKFSPLHAILLLIFLLSSSAFSLLMLLFFVSVSLSALSALCSKLSPYVSCSVNSYCGVKSSCIARSVYMTTSRLLTCKRSAWFVPLTRLFTLFVLVGVFDFTLFYKWYYLLNVLFNIPVLVSLLVINSFHGGGIRALLPNSIFCKSSTCYLINKIPKALYLLLTLLVALRLPDFSLLIVILLWLAAFNLSFYVWANYTMVHRSDLTSYSAGSITLLIYLNRVIHGTCV